MTIPVKSMAMIETLGIGHLNSDEQEEILAMVDQRLEEVLLRTMVENLSDDEAEEMKAIVAEGKDIEEKVTAITAGVPMLATKIELAIQKEIRNLRQAILR